MASTLNDYWNDPPDDDEDEIDEYPLDTCETPGEPFQTSKPWIGDADIFIEEEADSTPPPPRFQFDVELPDHYNKSLDDLNGDTPTCFVRGVAGSGKTTLIQQKLRDDPTYGTLVATTGVAAINLGGITINSALAYAGVDSLHDAYSDSRLARKMREIKEAGFRWIICDEGSMLSKKALNYIMYGLRDVNGESPGSEPLGLMLVADFGQLPPIGEKLHDKDGRILISRGREVREDTPWVFHSEEWPPFESNTITLDKVHRQSDATFLQAINAIRNGRGNIGAGLLKSAGVNYIKTLNDRFDGTTIVATNDEVDKINLGRLIALDGRTVKLTNSRWSIRDPQPSEWKNIPEYLQIKLGAYVMILTNDPPMFSHVNGDCGWVRGFEQVNGQITLVNIELVRNGKTVAIPQITRKVEQRAEPTAAEKKLDSRVRLEQYGSRGKWVVGEIEYWPIRLVYATTVHKAQGLSLDRVQLDPRARFFGSPNMAYVSVSRARTAQGLYIVGDLRTFAQKVRVDQKIKRYL